jgi:hypothetical protein
MKKLVFLLVFLPLIVEGQTKMWNQTFVIDSAMSNYTLYPTDELGNVGSGDIAAYPWTATIRTIGLTGDLIISIGSSNDTITGTFSEPKEVTFIPFNNTDFPYTFNPAKDTASTNSGEVRYLHNFKSPEPYGYKRPAVKITTVTDTVFTLIVNFVFAK